eukprot:CAMPEP_0172313482 /NCGR_PEP_ID=MMETSP1058-20130122/20279_1 /TAXON_ID=83371 /ORGANISM="Detonula confervacea, Strain CCMP 353" /LENGTH=422 /DNA_ID=CAMNT_0013027139 /DNA_START=192 /DNA_END=1456 /DNA_ORIENTATION=+
MSGDNDSKKPIPASNTSIQNANWSGSIPILLSLAPTSLSSPTMPRPIHKMITRVTYLHVALHEEVMQLSSYAPVAATGLLASAPFSSMSVEEPPDSPTEDMGGESGEKSGSSDNVTDQESSKSPVKTKQPNKQQAVYPECWFEDEESGVPLRWHLFVGILYDLMKGNATMANCSSWKGVSIEPSQYNFLPWRIRLHFTSYPTDHLLPLDDGSPQPKLENANNNVDDSHDRIITLVRRIFRNSLKAALFLQYASSKVAMSINKSSHVKMWDAVLQSNYGSYHEVNAELQAGISSPAISIQSNSNPTVVKDDQSDIPQLIPVRLMLNGMPAIQKPIKHQKDAKDNDCKKRPTELLEQIGKCHAPPYTTLGDVLAGCFPNHFAVDPSTGWVSVTSDDSTLYYCIQGVQPSLKCAIVDLWKALSHP